MKNKDLPPGSHLDTLIAEKVLGWTRLEKPYYGCTHKDSFGGLQYPQEYSTDLSAAFEIVDYLNKANKDKINGATDGFLIAAYFEEGLSNLNNTTYHVRFEYESTSYMASSTTLPHAICLAALKINNHN